MKQEKDATTRIAKYNKLREEIKNMPGDGDFDGGKAKSAKERAATQTIPINNNEMFDTTPLNIEKDKKSKDSNFKDAPIFKKYQSNKTLLMILYGVLAFVVLCVLIALIVWMAKTL